MMDLFADIAAVQSRIAEISGLSASAGTPQAAPGFAHALAAAIGRPEESAQPSPPPAPVPPAQLDALIEQHATTWQIDPALVKAVIANESGFDANATSNAGAQGLMQLMPQTAASLGVRDPYDPAQNVAGGVRYLRGLLDRFGGNLHLAVAAYNAGPGAVEKYGGVPPYAETRNYVENVLASYDTYRTHSLPQSR
jgi:soluble lytic murein transglycosylase-like protein